MDINLNFDEKVIETFVNQLDLTKEEHFFDFEKARLFISYIPSVNSSNQLLLLINGFQRTSADFKLLRKRIQEQLPHLNTLSLDNRGCGQTESQLDSWDIQRMARDAAFIGKIFSRKLKSEKYSVIGISMGGMIAQALSIGKAPIEKLILVSTSAKREKEETFSEFPLDLEKMKERLKPYFGKKFLETSSLMFGMIAKSMIKALENKKTHKDSKNQFDAVTKFDSSSFLNRIAESTLIITGEEDKVILPENSKKLYEKIKGSKLISYPDIGHLILVENPVQFAKDIAQFLRE